jgi:hypothetical protein
MAKVMKKAQTGKNVPKGMVESEMFPGKMIPKSKSNYENSNYDKMLGAKKAPAAKPKAKAKVVVKPKAKNGKQMIKRADGSTSQRGLWDNIRAAKGSGKKPTAAMLKQEKKIKAKTK